MRAAKQANQGNQASQVMALLNWRSTCLACLAWLACLSPSSAHAEEGSTMEMVRRTVNQSDSGQEWSMAFGPRAGVFMPINQSLRDTYGGSLYVYGMELSASNKDVGIRFEVNYALGDRLLPFNEANKWKNVHSNLALTPFWLSIMKRFPDDPWTFYTGVGGSAMLVSERFRGESYVNGGWSYTDFTQSDTMYGAQVFFGLSRSRRFGFEMKYSYFPRRGSSGYADLGGITTSLSLSF